MAAAAVVVPVTSVTVLVSAAAVVTGLAVTCRDRSTWAWNKQRARDGYCGGMGVCNWITHAWTEAMS